MTATERIVRAYFDELEAGRMDAPLRHYAPDAVGTLHGQLPPSGREGMAAHFQALQAAIPDLSIEVLDVIAQKDRAAVRWRARGTFAGPGRFMGFEPTGAVADIEGADIVWVADGHVARLEAYTDGMTIARQLGLLPAQESTAERRLAGALNLRTRAARVVAGGAPEQIADGVWVVRGGFPSRNMNVYLVRDGDGVLCFDAGVESMTAAVAAAGASLGGITRVVLGHGHPDHRGVAPGLGVPVHCHPDNVADSEGDGGRHYFDFSKVKPHTRLLMPRMLDAWDGGPVQIAGTVEENDEVAGFRVVLLAGHAPGLIGLWRESDRLALVSDCFYTLNPETGRRGHPRVPLGAFNLDTEQARASIRKLAAMEPAAAWPGHVDPVTGDVRSQLERAADTT